MAQLINGTGNNCRQIKACRKGNDIDPRLHCTPLTTPISFPLLPKVKVVKMFRKRKHHTESKKTD